VTTAKYNPVTPDIAAELKRIVGDRYVIYGDPEKVLKEFADSIQ